jgi:DNA-binding CsgD family transcriptional regulator
LREPRDRVRLAIALDDTVFAEEIAAALREVSSFELVGTDEQPDVLVVPGRHAAEATDSGLGLTARELEVLALLAEGASNKLIARRLGISTHTAKYHVASLLEKLDAVSRTDAVAHAARLKVITL